jgi:hypothetical protein
LTGSAARTRLLRVVAGGAVVFVLAGSTGGVASPAGAGGPALRVVAANLDNPRKLFVAPDGAVYVVEAGTGGHDKCLGTGPGKACVGLTGGVTRVRGGTRQKVVTGLWSIARADRLRAQGPADVFVKKGTYYLLLQDTVIDSKGANALGPDGATAGDLVSTPPGKYRPTVIADLAAFEAAHDPDHGAGPGKALGDPSIDSDPYDFAPYRGGFAVADAAANDLLWVSPKGEVSLLAVFPTQTEKLTLVTRRQFGIRPGVTSISAQSVPSSVAVGPDGALYVGELTGLPFNPGTARIWRVVPGKKPSVYASGFTNISDLAFAGKNLLVLEYAAKGVLDPSSPGALIRVAPGGSRTVVASAGLVAPTGLALGGGFIYISNYGASPGSGSGPHGQVVRLPASLAS